MPPETPETPEPILNAQPASTIPVAIPANDSLSGQAVAPVADPTADPSWLKSRLERAERSAADKLLKEFGFEKAEDLKALVEGVKKAREAEMTETQKLQSALDVATKKIKDAEDRATQFQSERRAERLDSAIKDAAKGVQFPDDVLQYVRSNYADQLETAIDKDGKIDAKAVERLIVEVKKARPTWFTSGTPGSPSNAQGRPLGANENDKQRMADEYARNLRRKF